MKLAKALAMIFCPLFVTAIVWAILFSSTGNTYVFFSHDTAESHLHSALVPLVTMLSVFLGFIPALFLFAQLLYGIKYPDTKEVEIINKESLTNTYYVGELVSMPMHNCKIRIKNIKNFGSQQLAL